MPGDETVVAHDSDAVLAEGSGSGEIALGAGSPDQMPVYRYRTFEEAADQLVVDRDDPRLARRLAWVLSLAGRLAPQLSRAPGVRKFRSFEEAQSARELEESGRSAG